MSYQHIENLLIRFRGQSVTIKTASGGVYLGSIVDVTNDYVALKTKSGGDEDNLIIVLLHSIESVSPQIK
jgi:ferredoxin-fold anticodon binding domain-containing protein